MELLEPEEIRVLACLVEKGTTVPDTYPLTLNALRQACNQSTNRAPIVAYDELTVQRAVDRLKLAGLVRFVHPAHGERATKFRHVLDEALGLLPEELAVLAVLGLRGPQTSGELRTRCERYHPFPSPEAVEVALQGLADREPPLVLELPRQAGQQQARWVQLLGGPVDVEALAPFPDDEPGTAVPPRAPGTDLAARVRDLEAEVGALRSRLAALERDLGVNPNPTS